ncbi:hypothetical protein SAMN02910358_01321 [Lachnospiraceae bacterium XBB1006]|nr:hypothetical protein SAMN02910358_01321 [Lachnospiraceae bacterium XBB1006]
MKHYDMNAVTNVYEKMGIGRKTMINPLYETDEAGFNDREKIPLQHIDFFIETV